MKCTRCGSERSVKCGRVPVKQRRVCGVCGTEIAHEDYVMEANGWFPCRRCGTKREAKYSPAESWRQRYQCSDCGRHYTLLSETAATATQRRVRWALILYLSGLSTHKIAEALSVSHVTVMNWLQKYGAGFDEIRCPDARFATFRNAHSLHDSASRGKPCGEGLLIIEQRDETLVSLSTAERQPKDIWNSVFDHEYFLR